ncbi:MAG: SUMF1/EgtB/PvdO family nonheme iron enzyme [Anaerolineaceae bacterium]|nr:SUMF1/EgtB/PvdO family nonheme iron enzyme [Anaerolineaceae bacterium]
MDDLRNRLDEITRKISSYENLRSDLGNEIVDTKISALRAEYAGLEQQLLAQGNSQLVSSTRLDPFIQGIVNRSVTIEGNASGMIIVVGEGNRLEVSGEQIGDLFLRAYLRALAEECSHLPLGVIDPRLAPSPLQQDTLRLADVYTDLDVISAPNDRTEDHRQFGRRLALGQGESRAPLMEVVCEAKNKRLALLGDAGSGKTSFVNYLTYRLAQSILTGETEKLPKAIRGYLPLRIVLRKAARHIPLEAKCGTSGMLWETIQAHMVDLLGQEAAKWALIGLQARMDKGPLLLLLDGLDEVPEAGRRRACLLQAIQSFLSEIPKSSRAILTARPYAYADPRWQLPRFDILALAPFSKEQVEGFVRQWYKAARSVLQWDEIETKARANGLLAVMWQRRYLADLASRPLLLTLIAGLNASQKRLPEDRADLYEQSVQLLLTQWQRQSITEDPDGKPLVDYGILRVLGMDERDLRSGMARLAYEVHEKQGLLDEDSRGEDAPADIPLGTILEILGKATPVDLKTDVVVEYLDRRSGLLVAREKGIYSFPHRSFQEYLAGCHLTNQADFHTRICVLAGNSLEWWREVILLAIGKVRQGGEGQALSTLQALVPGTPEELEQVEDSHWRRAALAGTALLELRLQERAAGDEQTGVLVKRLRRWLLRLVEEGRLPARERAEAGDILGKLGDPRFAPNLMGLPALFRGKPEESLGFVRISAGLFIMGSREGEEGAFDNEYGNPEPLLISYDYWMARYPVTVGQYAHFVQEQGYENQEWWSQTGWDWRTGKYDSKVEDRIFRDWLTVRKLKQRGAPYWWQDQLATPTRPVIGVSWFEAMAYAKWVNQKLSALSGPFGMLRDQLIARAENPDAKRLWRDLAAQKIVARLPTEAEWEKAARGADRRRYPWGNADWDEESANIGNSNISHSSPVGMYPHGATPEEIMELSGNVSEWMLSGYRPYPYIRQSHRLHVSENAIRVLRGGSWDDIQRNTRCAVRDWSDPDDFRSDIGIRLVLSPALGT